MFRGWHRLVGASGGEVDRYPREVGRLVGLERHHRPQQDRADQEARERQEQTGRDVGSVREADREETSLVDVVLVYGPIDEPGELVGAVHEVLVVEDALGEPAEEARHAVFEDLAAWAQERGPLVEHAADGQEIVFVTAGTAY